MIHTSYCDHAIYSWAHGLGDKLQEKKSRLGDKLQEKSKVGCLVVTSFDFLFLPVKCIK
jgi:hypothetical protein